VVTAKADRKEQITEEWGPSFPGYINPEDNREYLLADLRLAHKRAELLVRDIQRIGIALKGGVIDCETALEWLWEANCLDFLTERMEG
jgi:hypothetical protein